MAPFAFSSFMEPCSFTCSSCHCSYRICTSDLYSIYFLQQTWSTCSSSELVSYFYTPRSSLNSLIHRILKKERTSKMTLDQTNPLTNGSQTGYTTWAKLFLATNKHHDFMSWVKRPLYPNSWHLGALRTWKSECLRLVLREFATS